MESSILTKSPNDLDSSIYKKRKRKGLALAKSADQELQSVLGT